MSSVERKPVLGVSNQGMYIADGRRLESTDSGSRGIVLSML